MSNPLLVIAFVALMFAAVTALGWITGMREHQRVRCPEKKQEFEVDFHRRLDLIWDPGKRTDVERCTAFDDAGRVRCSKACLNV